MSVLYSESDIRSAIDDVAGKIVADIGPQFVMVPILTGGFLLAADLGRALYRAGADPEVDFLQLASYGDARESSGTIRVVKDLTSDVAGQTVLLVDDVLDSGRSVAFARDMVLTRGATRVVTCVAVDKRKARIATVEAEYALFRTDGDAFLVGYGMDDAGARRCLPDIGVVA